MILDWQLHAPTSLLAQQLRRDIRARRRSFPTGQRFIYLDLRELWAAQEHVVLTHHRDPLWQHWARRPQHGWVPVGLYPERADAAAAAENHEWEIEWPQPAPEPGVYVLAGWPHAQEGEEISYTVRTRCSTKNTAIATADALRALGMVTKHEEVNGE